jgi:hypothetical protein
MVEPRDLVGGVCVYMGESWDATSGYVISKIDSAAVYVHTCSYMHCRSYDS